VGVPLPTTEIGCALGAWGGAGKPPNRYNFGCMTTIANRYLILGVGSGQAIRLIDPTTCSTGRYINLWSEIFGTVPFPAPPSLMVRTAPHGGLSIWPTFSLYLLFRKQIFRCPSIDFRETLPHDAVCSEMGVFLCASYKIWGRKTLICGSKVDTLNPTVP